MENKKNYRNINVLRNIIKEILTTDQYPISFNLNFVAKIGVFCDSNNAINPTKKVLSSSFKLSINYIKSP